MNQKQFLIDYEIKHNQNKIKINETITANIIIDNEGNNSANSHERIENQKRDISSPFIKEKFIKQLEDDVRKSGVGSAGGHIARELSSPGPLNGHRPISAEDRFVNPLKIKFTDIKLHSNDPLNLPEWVSIKGPKL